MKIIINLLYCVVFVSNSKVDYVIDEIGIDYTKLAHEIEIHKEDVLGILGEQRIKDIYSKNYQLLLNKLRLKAPKNVDYLLTYRRIVSGQNTSIASLPWQVSIREKTFPICGGSVITQHYLLTAAHCLIRAKASELSVRLGSSWKSHGGEMYDVEHTYIHPKYTSKLKTHDVGILKLYTALRFTSRIIPIPIVQKEKKLIAGLEAIVSGWGKLKEGGPGATFLQSSLIKTVPMKLCRQSGLDRKAIDPDTMFCAGSFSQDSPDACQGDSGGPLVSGGVLIGVVSWGLGCARGNFPGVYSRLATPPIWDWVHQILNSTTTNNDIKTIT